MCPDGSAAEQAVTQSGRCFLVLILLQDAFVRFELFGVFAADFGIDV